MRSRVLLRTLTITLAAVLLWLASASSADAAPNARHARSGALCEAQPTGALKKLLRRAKSYGGPLATKARASRLGLRLDLTPHFRRAKHANAGDDEAAIQSDAPAARLAAHDGTLA